MASHATELRVRGDTAPDRHATPVQVVLSVNGVDHELVLDPRVSLLDCLREHLHLTGTKKGCNQGACGTCTVLVDGERINACMALAVQYDGREITTIEGLSDDPLGRAVQETFVAHDAFQCGYCTPGQVCSVVALLAEIESGWASAVTEDIAGGVAQPGLSEIRERMAGNLCRCGAYDGIVAAIGDLQGRRLRR
jgi:xanthine dehydrogenase YagT iron-sulfur-binding subunit